MTEIEGLGVSIAIEAPLAFAAARALRPPGRGPVHVALAAAVATAVTHPQVWALALWGYNRFPLLPLMLCLEVGVVLTEGCLIAWMTRTPWRQAAAVSLIANSGSFIAGLLLRT
jgi:hypothetical protein